MTTVERKKYHIILLENITSAAVRKITFKIPSSIKHCKGFMFSGNMAGLTSSNYMLGNVSLFFNDRKIHPLHYTIHSKPLDLLKRRIEPLKLDECICGGSFIQGYYVDLGTAVSYPYALRIYLDCIQNYELQVSLNT